jgi:hypothetical protein
LIECKDVIRLKVPFPNISSTLAYTPHMYICYEKNGSAKALVKCQSFKIGLITGANRARRYVKEQPDIARNPFNKLTLIDCDKLFTTDVRLPLSLLTTNRRDICAQLHADIRTELNRDGYTTYALPTDELQLLNPAI